MGVETMANYKLLFGWKMKELNEFGLMLPALLALAFLIPFSYASNFNATSNLSTMNQTILNVLLANNSAPGVIVSNVTIPAVNFSEQNLSYSDMQTILLNLTAGASGSTISHGALACPHSITNPNCNDFLNITNETLVIPYGKVRNGSKYYTPDDSLYYIGIDNVTGRMIIYNYTVEKATPVLAVTIGNVTETGNANVLVSDFERVPGGFRISDAPYNMTIKLESAALNNLTYRYSMRAPETSVLNTVQSDNISVSNGFSLMPGQTLNVTFESEGNANYTAVDPTVFFTVANVNEVINSGSVTLGSDLVAGNLTIDAGNTLTTDGYNIYIANTLTNNGIIMGGSDNSGAPQGNTNGNDGTSFTSSFGGSGGAGGQVAVGGTGGNGGSTTVAGGISQYGYLGGATPGSSATFPTITNSLIQTWYANGITPYLEGAGGGAGGGNYGGATTGTGGSGSYGTYIQALVFTSNILSAAGANGGACSASQGSGGGGGGSFLIAYGNSISFFGSNTLTGGTGSSGCYYGEYGSSGGAGVIDTYHYTTMPINVVENLVTPVLTASITPNAIALQTEVFTATVSGGEVGYTYNYSVVNAMSGLTIAFQSYSNSLSSNTFSWIVPSNTIGIEIKANVVITDSQSTIANSTYTANILVVSLRSTYPTVPISLSNGQSSATAAPFQQMIYFNPTQSSVYTTNESNDLGNIRFYQGANELYSWCESGCNSITSSNAVFWIKLPNGIASDGNAMVNMTFFPASITEYDGVYAGEAPQLSCNNPANTISGCASGQYGEYDNGANVFTLYDGFAGNTLSGLWNHTGTVNVDNGISAISGSISSSSYNSLLYVGDTYGYAIASVSPLYAATIIKWGPSGSTPNYGIAPSSSTQYSVFTFASGISSGTTITTGSESSPRIWSLVNAGSGATGIYDYSTSATNTAHLLSNPNATFGLYAASSGSAVHSQWMRLRTYPPNGIMPSESLGSLS
jgi:hypothetical protein